MSEENKNLGDQAKETFNEAKETAKDAAEKAGEKAADLKEDAKEVLEDAKEAGKEFVDDAKEALSDGKTIAIVAHLTIIGFIIALVMNSSNRTEFGSFYIRQTLGIFLLSLVWIIPVIGWIAGILVFVLWIVSLVGALGGNKKPVFLLGEQFQDWFKSI
ncbi:MAG: YtxH domain-containing protein [Flavobacteriaceae bacterium]|nr:YtxH domain-containing protein [Flavobacteriaceae bacterium]